MISCFWFVHDLRQTLRICPEGENRSPLFRIMLQIKFSCQRRLAPPALRDLKSREAAATG
jgi:hypothetical protein